MFAQGLYHHVFPFVTKKPPSGGRKWIPQRTLAQLLRIEEASWEALGSIQSRAFTR